jgi:hypothetical protein
VLSGFERFVFTDGTVINHDGSGYVAPALVKGFGCRPMSVGATYAAGRRPSAA